MNKTLKRLRDVGYTSILSFIMISIAYKLIFRYDDWLFKSLGGALSYGLAWLLKLYMFEAKVLKKTLFLIAVSFSLAIATLFVSGVCLSLDDCWWHTFYITVAFTVGYIRARPSKYEEDKPMETKVNKEKEDTHIVV